MCSGLGKVGRPAAPICARGPLVFKLRLAAANHMIRRTSGPPRMCEAQLAVVPEPFVDWPAERSLAPHPTAVAWRASGPRGAEDLLSQTHCMRLYRE